MPTLAARCARAIPTLQYFVLSDDGPGYAHVTWDKEERYKSGAPCPSSEEEREREERRRADFEEDEDELDECCFYRDPSSMGYAETLQTWRVVREDTDAGAGAGCRLEPLTHAAGKELHRALVSTFDGRNPPLTGELLDLLVCYTSKVVLTPVASMCRERRAIPLNVLGPAGDHVDEYR